MSLTDLMSHAGLAFYAEVAEVVFFIAFLGIAWWVFRPGNRARFNAEARLPLDDNQPATIRRGGPTDGR